MRDVVEDAKRKAILDAAWRSFAAYGFRKTSMDDIARGAGVSRPALYLHYRNKEDIFRSLAEFYYDDAARQVAQALATPGPVAEVLGRAFDAQGGATLEAMLSSPHGLELLDTGSATASDIAEAGEARLRRIYADWLKTAADAGQVHLPGGAEAAADAITAALKGIKGLGADYPTYKARVHLLAQMVGAGLEA